MIAKVASLQEIETHWNLMDLVIANEAMDISARSERRAFDQAKKKRGKG